MSTKLEFYMREIPCKLYICWEISWKLYAGNLLMETMGWEIWMDASGFLKRVIMAAEHPGSTDLSRMMCSEASEVIGSVKQGMGMQNPSGSGVCSSWWTSVAASK